jgi:hypothetical protein
MYPPTNTNNIPGQIEAALQYLRFAEEIRFPINYGDLPKSGRELSKTEFEVMDSAHIVLLQYFNQAVPMPDFSHTNHPSSASENADD